ncbi:hypothetical protein D3C73_1314910 [compost metagenome]
MVVMAVGQHDVGEGAEIDPHHGGVMAQRPAPTTVEQHPEAVTLQQQRQPSLGQTTRQMNLIIHQDGKLQHLNPPENKTQAQGLRFESTTHHWVMVSPLLSAPSSSRLPGMTRPLSRAWASGFSTFC